MLAKQAQRSVSTLMDHPAAQPIRFVTLGYALRNEMVIGLNMAFWDMCLLSKPKERA